MHDAFFSDILANPEDDTPRLVYADWLDENGDVDRAEFIRAQIAAARGEGKRRDRKVFAEQLVEQWQEEWLGEAGEMDGVDQFVFRRGFVSACVISFDELRRGIQATVNRLLGLHPIESVQLFDATLPRLRAFLRCPRVGQLRKFSIFMGDTLGLPLARLLANCPNLQRLRRLELGSLELGAEGLGLLLRGGKFSHLRALNIAGNRLGPDGAALLAGGPLGPLRELWIDDNPLGAEGLAALVGSPTLSELREVHFSQTQASDGGAAAIANSPHLGNLRELDLHSARLTDEGAVALAASPHLLRLRCLTLSGNAIGPTGMDALSCGRLLRRLRELNLVDVPIRPLGLAALLKGGTLGRLETLFLVRNELDGSAGQRLARAKLPALRHLHLTECALGEEGTRALMSAGWLAQLRGLSLDENGLTDEAARLIASQPALGQLRKLYLNSNRLSDDGVIALCESPHLRRLSKAWLHGNPVGRRGKAALRMRFGDTQGLN
jgi:uncharacterized protein (TIGR02996 family)